MMMKPKGFPCEQRRGRTDMFLLKIGRLRTDLIQVDKVIYKIEDILLSNFFHINA